MEEHLCALGLVPLVRWMHLDRYCVTSVRMGTLEPTVRSKYD